MRAQYRPPNPLARAVWTACIAELEAFKPGNVSFHAAGHGMGAEDFVTSARCLAAAMTEPGLGVGQRVWRGVAATRRAVGCNTNLGIALLGAPLVKAAQDGGPAPALRPRLRAVLAALDLADTRAVFRAIRLASPAGLGASASHDVRRPARAPLGEVMALAAGRDRIARQYARGYPEVFELGLPRLRGHLADGRPRPWATLGLYLDFLSAFRDSHVERKFGNLCAEALRREAAGVRAAFAAAGSEAALTAVAAGFDRDLKRRGINPGTSADLTVATLLAEALQKLLEDGVGDDRQRAAADPERKVSA